MSVENKLWDLSKGIPQIQTVSEQLLSLNPEIVSVIRDLDVIDVLAPIQSLVAAPGGNLGQLDGPDDLKYGSGNLDEEEEELQKKLKELQQKKEKERIKKEQEEWEREYEEREKQNEHQGEEKHGDNWYKEGEKETWSDTFKEEEQDIEKKLTNIWEWAKYIGGLIFDMAMIVFNMSKGFLDQGKSFDEGFELLDKDYHQTDWLSDATLDMIEDERDTFMVDFDFTTTGPRIFVDWYKGRLANFKNIEPVPLIENLLLFILVTVLDAPGKFSIFSPIFTGWSPTLLTFNCVAGQFVANLWINHWFAEGNVYLISMQAFTLLQWSLMLLLVWNNELYLYDLRIIRYFSEFMAAVFNVGYIMMVGIVLDLVYVKGALEKDNNIYDVLMALYLGYNLFLHAPTFVVNFFIVAKELTLNQFAWRADQDYQEGKIYNTVDMDVFSWFGISEDPKLYLHWLMRWGRQFL